MKKFKLEGPMTSREFEIADDEMVQTYILKIVDYDALQNIHFPLKTYDEQNVKIYDTVKERGSEGTE